MTTIASCAKRLRSLAERVVTCLPAATFEMETLVKLAGIVPSRDVPTAAVTCRGRARMLINPDFVERHCRRDEHLFLLVMHELWHVILGHTRMYPRLTPAHNVAFDAVINAALARQFAGPEYRGFFEALNPADEFPGLLLRPPMGWPGRPEWRTPAEGPSGLSALLKRLYPVGRLAGGVWHFDSTPEMPTYAEILALLQPGAAESDREDRDPGEGRPGDTKDGPNANDANREHVEREEDVDRGDEAAEGRVRSDAGAEAPEGGPSGTAGVSGEPFLLGNHDDAREDERAMQDPLFGDTVRRIVSRWPPPPVPIAGRDAGGPARDWSSALGPCPGPVRRAFQRVLQRALGPARGVLRRRVRGEIDAPIGSGVLPEPRDRLVHARRRLGGPVLLHEQRGPVRTREPEEPRTAHVYLDVSGSMSGVLPWLLDLLAPHAASGAARVFQFSTNVCPITAAELRRGGLRTTLGTNIDAVLEHALDTPRLRRVLILTDGYTGGGRTDLVVRIAASRMKLHVVLPDECAYTNDLGPIAASMTRLPPLSGMSAPGSAGASRPPGPWRLTP